MHIQIVRFSRVFDLEKGSSKFRSFTQFGFELEETSIDWAYVHLHADLAAGRKLALAILKPNSWRQIYGVADCESGKLYVERGALGSIVGLLLMGLVAQAGILPLTVLSWSELSTGGQWGAAAGNLMIGLITFTGVLTNYRLLLAARALERFVSNEKPRQS